MASDLEASLQNLSNNINQASGMAFNASESKKGRKWQEEMWKKTYDKQLVDNLRYNSPSAMISRMKSAGLNTNLAYGSGMGSQPFQIGGETPSSPTASAPSMYYADPLMVAQVHNIEADTANKIEENKGISLQNEAQKIANFFAPQLNRGQVDNLMKDLQTKDQSIKQMQTSIDKMVKDMTFTDEQMKQIKATITSIEYDNAYKKAVNDLKIPMLENGFDPDASVSQMLVRFLLSTFVGWKSNHDGLLGKIWDSLIGNFSEGLQDAKEDAKETLGIK